MTNNDRFQNKLALKYTGFKASATEWMRSTFCTHAYLLVEIFPVVLSHQSEEREESPTKVIKAGEAIIWIVACFVTEITIWALPGAEFKKKVFTHFKFLWSFCQLAVIFSKNKHKQM